MTMNEITWTCAERLMGEIYENPTNPRELSEAAFNRLETSIKTFGLCEPLVIQPDGLIIGGHQRYKIAAILGMEKVAVYVPNRHLSNEEYRQLSIGLNKDVGDWDYDLLSTCYEIDQLLALGFTDKELGIDIEEKNPHKKFCVTINFASEIDLDEAYEHIERIVNSYAGAKCKKRIKNNG